MTLTNWYTVLLAFFSVHVTTIILVTNGPHSGLFPILPCNIAGIGIKDIRYLVSNSSSSLHVALHICVKRRIHRLSVFFFFFFFFFLITWNTFFFCFTFDCWKDTKWLMRFLRYHHYQLDQFTHTLTFFCRETVYASFLEAFLLVQDLVIITSTIFSCI